MPSILSRCSGGTCSMRRCADGDLSISRWIRRTISSFCAPTMPKMRLKIAVTSHGTHQLELRLTSSNVFFGAMNALISRCGSERPGPANSGAADGYGGGGGGVGLVGKFIIHPHSELKGVHFLPARRRLGLSQSLKC